MAFGVLICLLFSATIAIYYWIHSKTTYFARHGFMSKKPTFPHGNWKGVGSEFHQSHLMKEFYEEFKHKSPVHGLYLYLLEPVFVITDLDLVKMVLIRDFDYFRNRGRYFTKDDVLSNHLFSIEDEPWKTMRNNLTPTFTSGKMKTMFHTVLDISEQLVDFMRLQDEIVEVKEVLAKFTTDVIGNVAFGLESNSFKDANSKFRKMGKKFFSMDRKRQFKNLLILYFKTIAEKLKITITPKDVSDFFIGTIREAVDYRQKNNIERKDFLDLLLKVNNGGKSLTLNEITAQCFIFWLGGFETSSTTAMFCLYFLSINPDTQDKLRNEIRKTLSKYDNQITYDGMKEMSYLQMVIDESLRLYGPVFNLLRKTEEDYKIAGTNLVIPKGVRIFIPIHSINTDADHYPEPNKFIPERFSEENKRNRHPMAHLPFGDGPRNCIGVRFGLMQTKISLIQLINNFKFSPSSKTPIPMVLHKTAVAMTPRDDMHLKVEKL